MEAGVLKCLLDITQDLGKSDNTGIRRFEYCLSGKHLENTVQVC